MSINETVKAYIRIKAEKKRLEEQEKELAELIKVYAKDNDCFTTEDYTVTIATSESIRLDIKALYADFPDIKKDYGKVTTSKTIKAFENASKKTA